MGSSTKIPSTTTTIQEMPYQAQVLANYLQTGAVDAYNRPYQSYDSTQRISPLTQQHQLGIGQATNQALYGSPEVNAARGEIARTVGGANLYGNPYLDATFNQAANRMSDAYARGTSAQTLAQFNQAGAFGGSAMQEAQEANNRAFADSLAQLGANVYGQNYAQERQRQVGLAALAPELASSRYKDTQALLGVGDVVREQDQALRNAQFEDFMRQLNYPYSQLDVLANAIRGITGGGGGIVTAPNPYQPNRTANVLGGAAAGAGIGEIINQGYGGYGAGLGGLLGAFA
jgi:hypothetical protein